MGRRASRLARRRDGVRAVSAPLRVLDLFSGIGGFSFGLERTGGFKTVAFCEIEPFPRRVLQKHWPEVPIYDDVRTLSAARLAADGIGVDVICGGFPCQDISFAGQGAGIDGARSGLWGEYARLIGELRPSYVIVENVAALLGRGLDRVLGDLAALGFDAEWHCIPASAVGAPHRRDRLWLVAYPGGEQHEGGGLAISRALAAQLSGSDNVADADSRRGSAGKPAAAPLGHRRSASASSCPLGDANGAPSDTFAEESGPRRPASQSGWWLSEPDVGRVAHGVPTRVDRLRGLGNAVVPQIPELIGRAILEARAAA